MQPIFVDITRFLKFVGRDYISFAQEHKSQKLFEIYGLVMTDAGYNYNQINPDYSDVVRPSQLPEYKAQHGTDGNFYFSIQQSSFGVKGFFLTPLGEVKAIFEFDLFGLGKRGSNCLSFQKGICSAWTFWCWSALESFCRL